METNVRLYPYYQFCRNLLFWFPIFFLYFSSLLPIDRVLLLEAFYYLSVVVLEVPSGYLSDRIGRRTTLLIGTLAWVAASVLFVAAPFFAALLVAQFLFAASMAFNSGTDSALLYESLKAIGRADSVAAEESRAHTCSFVALSLSALIGGALAGVDLRVAYVLSGIAGCASLVLVWRFVEPPVDGHGAHTPLRQVLAVGTRLGDPVLRWLLLFVVAMTVLDHVPYELFQTYLSYLFGAASGPGFQATPAISGVLVALMMALAAIASAFAVEVNTRIGVGGTLLLAVVAQLVIIAAMGSVLSAAVMALIVLRSVPMAVTRPVIYALIHPRLPSAIRATYLSVQSLAGRLAFAGTLALASVAVGGVVDLTWSKMSDILWGYGVATLALMPLFLFAAWRLQRLDR